MPLSGERLAQSRAAKLHLAMLVALSCAAYAPFQTLPFISDDYTQIWLSRVYGSPPDWGELARDALYRCRSTSLILTRAIDSLFGLWAPPYFLTNLLIHIVNSWLVYALGTWKTLGYRVSAPAAYVFALREGHQEAVVWHAALPELLVFTFVLLTLLSWIRWLQSDGRGGWWYIGAMTAFLLALLSKESAVAAAAFVGLTGVAERVALKRLALAVAPFAVVSVVYAALIYLGRDHHLHLRDGTFDLSASWWVTLPNSFARMLWIWGAIGVLILWWMRRLRQPAVWIGLAGMAIGLFPYSFLLYMNRVPSRHTYLAGVGASLVIAAAFVSLRERGRRRLSLVLAAAFVIHNCGYLWIKKLPQYQMRAAPSERFLDYARSRPELIRIRCYPGSPWTARFAAHMVLGRPLASVIDATSESGPIGADEYCDLSKH